MNYWKLLAATLVTSMLLIMAGCNTTEGIGKDVEAVGEEIQEEVDERS